MIVIILHDQWNSSKTKKIKLSGYRKSEKTCSTNLWLWQHSCLHGWSSESRRREGDINMQGWESIQVKSPSEGHLVWSALFEGDHACDDRASLPCMLAPPKGAILPPPRSRYDYPRFARAPQIYRLARAAGPVQLELALLDSTISPGKKSAKYKNIGCKFVMQSVEFSIVLFSSCMSFQ